MSSRHAIGIHGYMLVYSVTSRSSLEMAKVIRDKILNHTVFARFSCLSLGFGAEF